MTPQTPSPTTPPADVWKRLARLNACCKVQTQGLKITDAFGPARHWEVTARPREADALVPIVARRRSLPEAVLAVLDEAKARGWTN